MPVRRSAGLPFRDYWSGDAETRSERPTVGKDVIADRRYRLIGDRGVVFDTPGRFRECRSITAAYSCGSKTIDPIVWRPPMYLCAAAASRNGKVFATLLSSTPALTASNRHFDPSPISLRVDM